MTHDAVLSYLQERLPDFSPIGMPEELSDGNLNFVWRVRGEERSVIVKHAPPYVAANPDIPLDPSRLEIEGRCLQILGRGGRLERLSDAQVRPPRPIQVDAEEHVLVMEDLGEVPSFGEWLHHDDPQRLERRASEQGEWLGRFIGRLHAATYQDADWAEAFENRAMQETRHAVQYQGVGEMLKIGGVSDAVSLGTGAEALGERLMEPGRCLTMGDLWPPSVRVVDGGLRLIDWELAHFGRPLQDVAHWLAHLWMQDHRAPSSEVVDAVDVHRKQFVRTYRRVLEPLDPRLWDRQERIDAARHFGAEILVRAVGPFQEGYVYEGLSPDSSPVQEAVRTAARHLRSPDRIDLLEITS